MPTNFAPSSASAGPAASRKATGQKTDLNIWAPPLFYDPNYIEDNEKTHSSVKPLRSISGVPGLLSMFLGPSLEPITMPPLAAPFSPKEPPFPLAALPVGLAPRPGRPSRRAPAGR